MHALTSSFWANLTPFSLIKLAEVAIPASAFNGTAKWLQWPIGPVAVKTGVQYMVTATTGTDSNHNWAGCPSCWGPAGSNGHHITWPANSARFSPGIGEIPATTPANGEIKTIHR
jgi:hypothetical protein